MTESEKNKTCFYGKGCCGWPQVNELEVSNVIVRRTDGSGGKGVGSLYLQAVVQKRKETKMYQMGERAQLFLI